MRSDPCRRRILGALVNRPAWVIPRILVPSLIVASLLAIVPAARSHAETPAHPSIVRRRDAPRTSSSVAVPDYGWMQWGHGAAHTGFNPYEQDLGPSNVSGVVQRWQAHDLSPNPPEVGLEADDPVVTGGIEFVEWWKTLYAIRSDTGTMIWSHTEETSGMQNPVVANGVVYELVSPPYTSQTRAGTLYAWNASSGALLWSTSAPATSEVGAYWGPTVANALLYISTDRGTVTAYRTGDGTVAWSREISTKGGVGARYICCTAPAENRGLVFVQAGGTVYAIGALHGRRSWTSRVLSVYQYAWDLSSADKTVFVELNGADVYALNLANGTVRWIWERGLLPGGAGDCQFAIAYHTIFITHCVSSVQAFDDLSGRQLWERNFALTQSSPKRKAASTTSSPADDVPVCPSIANRVIYVTIGSGTTYALSADDGTILWKSASHIDANAVSCPAIEDGIVYAGNVAYGLTS